MKLSIAIAAEKAPSSAFVVWRGFEASFQKAKDFGYHGVELALRSAKEFSEENLAVLLKAAGLSVSCISTGQFFAAEGLCFTHPDSAIRKRTVEAFRQLLPIAADWGGMVNIGRVRGSIPPGQSRERVENLFMDGLCALLPEAERLGVTLVIEPVNRYEINYINTVDEAVALAQKLDSPCIGVMPDLFHMNIEDDDICRALSRNSEYVRYVHLADTNRHSPGCGHMNFENVLQTLAEMKYQGWCSVEILPLPDPDTAAKRAADYLLGLSFGRVGKVWCV